MDQNLIICSVLISFLEWKENESGSGWVLGPTRQELSENPSQDPSDGCGGQLGLNYNGPMWLWSARPYGLLPCSLKTNKTYLKVKTIIHKIWNNHKIEPHCCFSLETCCSLFSFNNKYFLIPFTSLDLTWSGFHKNLKASLLNVRVRFYIAKENLRIALVVSLVSD